MGMGGSDSGGLIQQPLVDREVIPINDSSEEETRHGASDNKSSSSKRLTILHCVGGGTSRLRRRALPSVASLDGEPVPITTILPPSTFGRVKRNGGKDIMASPRVCRSHSAGSPSSPPTIAGCEWVN